ncbi:MAG TPA: dienelactone hydrolase family protein [Burkholderiaceae bacterium]|nr:dienelactone hydrolase family protein [Burkholderiaceae bacterium]
MMRRLLPCAVAALLALPVPAARAERIQLIAPDGVALKAHWMPRPEGGVGPAVVALHGCSGLFERTGTAFDPRYPEYVERLHRAGYHVLLPDSFGSRGKGSICAEPNGKRSITVETRRGDAIAAADWLSKRPDVDARRIVMLGWSHGGTTALSAVNSAGPAYARHVAAAIVFYPGCSSFLKQSFRLHAPVLMLLGEKDDWTPPGRCTEFAERARKAQPEVDLDVHLYSDSHHGFDSTQPVRFRTDVSTGVSPKGVHAGGNRAARAAALAAIDAFLDSRLGPARGAGATLPGTDAPR